MGLPSIDLRVHYPAEGFDPKKFKAEKRRKEIEHRYQQQIEHEKSRWQHFEEMLEEAKRDDHEEWLALASQAVLKGEPIPSSHAHRPRQRILNKTRYY